MQTVAVECGGAPRSSRSSTTELRARGIARAAVFGSVARGEHRTGSDVDIVVDLDRTHVPDVFAYVGIELDLAAWVGRPVHLAGARGAQAVHPASGREGRGVRVLTWYSLPGWYRTVPSAQPADRLQDILDNIARIERYVDGMTVDAFRRNKDPRPKGRGI